MSQEQNKKTLRQFQCRDYLWEIFQKMSGELECSTDYLINEAMRQYARSRDYGSSGHMRKPPPSSKPAEQSRSARASASDRVASPSGPTRSRYESRQSSSPAQRAANVPTSVPPPLPNTGSADVSSLKYSKKRQSLYLVFEGQKVPVTKDEYIIGRVSKAVDLTIRDSNISRRHAAVVYQDGAYFIKDLGSTNGIEFQGNRVDSKRIEEGDRFLLCDHEIQFTYR